MYVPDFQAYIYMYVTCSYVNHYTENSIIQVVLLFNFKRQANIIVSIHVYAYNKVHTHVDLQNSISYSSYDH